MIGIDPGARHFTAAWITADGNLFAEIFGTRGSGDFYSALAAWDDWAAQVREHAPAMYVEVPVVNMGRAYAATAALQLSFLCGAVVSSVRPVKAELIRPTDWKKTIPKPAHNPRDYLIYRRLPATIQKRLDIILFGRSKLDALDLIDAVGIAIWGLKRAQPLEASTSDNAHSSP